MPNKMERPSVYNITVIDQHGEKTTLSEYRGKVMLIVNTASFCRFTPQYAALQRLHDSYHAQGLEILAFPSNDFGAQEFAKMSETVAFCDTRYAIKFRLFGLTTVRGKAMHPLFKYLSSQWNGFRPLWNFQKYLIDREGRLRSVYLPFVPPDFFTIQTKIKKLLSVTQK